MSGGDRVSQARDWDFVSDMDDLLELQGSPDAWRRWEELRDAANSLVARAKESDPQQLQAWLDEHAVVLIGQQLLVRSVHRDRDTPKEMTDALRRWLVETESTAPATEAVAWLQREEPALMRAWMLSRLPELVDRELKSLRSRVL